MTEVPQHARPARDLAKPLRGLVGAAFVVIVMLTCAQVVFRFVLNSPLVWSEELVQLLLVWVVFVGAAVVCWDEEHLRVDVVVSRLPERWRRGVEAFNSLVTLAVLALLVVGAIPLIRLNLSVDMSALGIPLSWVRAPAVVGGVLMAVFVVLRGVIRQ